MQRRLAAILVADVVGYSALMERDEADTLSRLFALRTQLFEPVLQRRNGKIVKTTGDGVLAEFPSVVDAVAVAVEVQQRLGDWPDVGEPLQLRIGINLGDIVVRDDDIFGDAVNIAARLEQAADPGAILISNTAHDHLTGQENWHFEDLGPLKFKNIARPIRAWRWSQTGTAAKPPASGQMGKPIIAVLPFDNMSGDPEQAYFADGVVEDLITTLSKFHWFQVIARNSSFAFRGQAIDVGEIGRKLGARYVLEGSVRKAGSRVRVTAQLIDTSTNTHVWAERYDRVLEDIFDLQDEIVQSIVGTVVPRFVASFRSRASTLPRATISSWDLAMRGWDLVSRLNVTVERLAEARKLFDRAIEEDAENTLAYCGLAYSYGNPYYQPHIERDVLKASAAARKAVDIDDQDAFAWCLLGASEAWRSNLDEAERFLKRSISINPSLALAFGYLAAVACWRSDSKSADRWLERMKLLSPADPALNWFVVAAAMARFGEGEYAGALEIVDQVISSTPELPGAWRIRAITLELIGDHEGAKAAVQRLIALGPTSMKWVLSNITPFADPLAWETYLDALRRAGVPEE